MAERIERESGFIRLRCNRCNKKLPAFSAKYRNLGIILCVRCVMELMEDEVPPVGNLTDALPIQHTL